MTLYCGNTTSITTPEIIQVPYTKDFGQGFYCTCDFTQAARWAIIGHRDGVVNIYEYTEPISLKIKKFPKMSDEWIDFIAVGRVGKSHDYDIVEGPMVDDTIWSYVNDFLDGDISREAFWALVKGKNPARQVSFHTEKALQSLTFVKWTKAFH